MGHQASLNFATRQLHLYNGLTSVPLLSNTQAVNPAVHVLRTTSIPAFSEVLLPVKVSSSCLDQTGVIELLQSLLTNKKVLAARSLVTLKKGHAMCTIRNNFASPVKLRTRDKLGYFRPVQQVLGDLSEQSATVATADTQTSSADQLPQARSVLEQLGINLTDADLTQTEKDSLTIFLAQNRDIFAADMSELGETHLMTHTIDTGDATSIKQRSYRTSPALNAQIERQVNDATQRCHQTLYFSVVFPSGFSQKERRHVPFCSGLP